LAQADQVGGEWCAPSGSRRVGAVRTSGRRGDDPLVHTPRKLNCSGGQRPSVAGELALAVGQRPLDLAQASAVPLASWLAAMSASRVTSRVAGVEQAGEPAVQVGEQVDLAQVDGARMVEQSAGPRGR